MSTGRPDFIWPPAGDGEAATKPAPSNRQSPAPDSPISPIAELQQRLAQSHERGENLRTRPRRAAPLVIAALAIVAAAEGAVIAIQYSQRAPEAAAAARVAAARVIAGTRDIARSLTSDPAARDDGAAAAAPPTATTEKRAPAAHRRQKSAPRAAAAAPSPPQYGLLYLNALPWADVAIDGHPAGQTPLGRIQLTAGAHEVRFTHPQLGEQVREVVVDPNTATRLGVDLRQ